MAKTARDLSLVQLERLLNNRRSLLDGLKKKQDRLSRELAQVEKKIRAIEGSAAGGTRRRRGKRVRNEKSLQEAVLDILTKNKKGFPLSELAQKVLDSGYRTNSSNFKNVLYQCLYNSKAVSHDAKSGHYLLKS